MFRNTSSSHATSGQNQNPCLENQQLGVLMWDPCWLLCYLVSLPTLGTIHGSSIQLSYALEGFLSQNLIY